MKFSQIFCKSEKKITRYDHKCTLGFIKVPLIVVRIYWHLSFPTDFQKINANTIFMKIHPREAQFFHADGRTDRHDEANSCYS